MNTFDETIQEVLEVNGCKIIERDDKAGYALLKNPLFLFRIFDIGENYPNDPVWENSTVIQMGVMEFFDRWANSTDFQTERTKNSGCYYPLFWEQYKWAEKVLESKLFNFNAYHHTIWLPWFDTKYNATH